MKRKELAEKLLNQIDEIDDPDEKIAWVESFCNEIVDNYWLNHFIVPVSNLDTGLTYGACSLCGDNGVINSHCFTPTGFEINKKVFCICPNGQSLRKLGRNPETSYCPTEKDFKNRT